MKIYFICLVVFFSINNYIIGQNSIYVGTNSYSATDPWTFSINGYWSQGPAKVTVAKKTGGGLIMLSLASFDGTLTGSVMIYLENGSVIKCTDRGIKDEVDNKTIGVYYLSNSEMELMKKSDISSIRFSLKGDLQTKNYTMDNVYETGIGGVWNDSKTYKNSTAEDIMNIK